MNRVNKFRFWNIDTQQWIKNVNDSSGIELMIIDDDNILTPYNEHVNIVTQQYTGLNDINGKELFDGDIIKINDPYVDEQYVTIIMEYGAWGFLCHSNKLKEFHWVYDCEFEIVGNIFEHPNLLK